MKGLLITNEGETRIVEASGLKDYYKLIGCDCIDMLSLLVDGVEFVFVFDDNGRFNSENTTTVIYFADMKNTLFPIDIVGNVIVFKSDRTNIDSGCMDMSEHDIAIIESTIIEVGNSRLSWII